MLQYYQTQHYESVLKVIDVIPPGIVLPVTDIKSNKFKEAINDRALRARTCWLTTSCIGCVEH